MCLGAEGDLLSAARQFAMASKHTLFASFSKDSDITVYFTGLVGEAAETLATLRCSHPTTALAVLEFVALASAPSSSAMLTAERVHNCEIDLQYGVFEEYPYARAEQISYKKI